VKYTFLLSPREGAKAESLYRNVEAFLFLLILEIFKT
jgi:hypothetical protein